MMRKGIADGRSGTIAFTREIWELLVNKGYKFVQVKGLTVDNHYDYVEPNFLLLIPMMELPADQQYKDIYEPINSTLLQQWLDEEANDAFSIVVANDSFNKNKG